MVDIKQNFYVSAVPLKCPGLELQFGGQEGSCIHSFSIPFQLFLGVEK